MKVKELFLGVVVVVLFTMVWILGYFQGDTHGKHAADRWYADHSVVHEHWNWYKENTPAYEQQHEECPAPILGTDMLCGPTDGHGLFMSTNGGPYYRLKPGFIAAITRKGCDDTPRSH